MGMVMRRTILRIATIGICGAMLHGAVGNAASGEAIRVGPVFQIDEPDMLQEITRKLTQMKKDGSLARLQNRAIAQSRKGIEEPAPVALPRTQDARVWDIDPTYTVPQDLADHKGQVFAPAGTTVNPLERGARLREPLLFLNANDAAQSKALPKLLQQYPTARIVLTGGRWSELSKSLNRPVYFDQAGRLSQTFGITATPAVITQNNLLLQGHEIVP